MSRVLYFLAGVQVTTALACFLLIVLFGMGVLTWIAMALALVGAGAEIWAARSMEREGGE